jgi:hypothetical protein
MNIVNLVKFLNTYLKTKDGKIQLLVYILICVLIFYLSGINTLFNFILWVFTLIASTGLLSDIFDFKFSKNNKISILVSILFFVIISFIDLKFISLNLMVTAYVISILVYAVIYFWK